jgi:hypothetical protein
MPDIWLFFKEWARDQALSGWNPQILCNIARNKIIIEK